MSPHEHLERSIRSLSLCVCVWEREREREREREKDRREDKRNKDRIALLCVQGDSFGTDIDKNMGCPSLWNSHHITWILDPGHRAGLGYFALLWFNFSLLFSYSSIFELECWLRDLLFQKHWTFLFLFEFPEAHNWVCLESSRRFWTYSH
jgi:hypothetical protein